MGVPDGRGERLKRELVQSISTLPEDTMFSVVLFGVMSAGFGYASYTDIYGASDAFLIVSFVLGALCLASLVSALRSGGRGPRA